MVHKPMPKCLVSYCLSLSRYLARSLLPKHKMEKFLAIFQCSSPIKLIRNLLWLYFWKVASKEFAFISFPLSLSLSFLLALSFFHKREWKCRAHCNLCTNGEKKKNKFSSSQWHENLFKFTARENTDKGVREWKKKKETDGRGIRKKNECSRQKAFPSIEFFYLNFQRNANLAEKFAVCNSFWSPFFYLSHSLFEWAFCLRSQQWKIGMTKICSAYAIKFNYAGCNSSWQQQ